MINDGYPYLNSQPLLSANNVKTASVDVKIGPTQVDSSLNIITSENAVSYEIVDFSGKVAAQGSQRIVNVSSLVKGVYIINVKTAKGNKSLKFIKK